MVGRRIGRRLTTMRVLAVAGGVLAGAGGRSVERADHRASPPPFYGLLVAVLARPVPAVVGTAHDALPPRFPAGDVAEARTVKREIG